MRAADLEARGIHLRQRWAVAHPKTEVVAICNCPDWRKVEEEKNYGVAGPPYKCVREMYLTVKKKWFMINHLRHFSTIVSVHKDISNHERWVKSIHKKFLDMFKNKSLSKHLRILAINQVSSKKKEDINQVNDEIHLLHMNMSISSIWLDFCTIQSMYLRILAGALKIKVLVFAHVQNKCI